MKSTIHHAEHIIRGTVCSEHLWKMPKST